ncbi:hypothetical protein BBJ28_00021632 [Nothophytophthora sp. Chile5]|nr:hypothetical protein BBJ28_00021632 [Nothophytophthora sp. Chile5]
MTYLVTLIAPANEFSSFDDIVLPSTIVSLNNNITEFEIRETDLTILANLANFTMDDLAQSDCPTSGATTETISNVQICVVSGSCLRIILRALWALREANIGVVYLSVAVSSLISIWFLALLVGHLTKKGKHAQTDTHLEKLELSGVTASRHWSLAKEEELPNDVRFDPELASLRIDPSDVMQVRSLAHGGFAMTSLVYFGDKQAVMKKVTMHTRGQDRNQMLAFMDEIRVCAKLDHPHVVAFLGIMWTNIAELSAIVEYVPRGNLALFLKEKKPTRKSARSMFTWMGASGDTPNKLSLALQIAEALVYLQSFSPPVIHGHLKAEVVLLGSDWATKLNGLGYQLDIVTRSIEGRAWVAPEVLTSGEFDEKSDIYSFGVVMSELDRCKRPFSRKESRRQSVEGAIPLKPTFRDDCPAEIQQIAQPEMALQGLRDITEDAENEKRNAEKSSSSRDAMDAEEVKRRIRAAMSKRAFPPVMQYPESNSTGGLLNALFKSPVLVWVPECLNREQKPYCVNPGCKCTPRIKEYRQRSCEDIDARCHLLYVKYQCGGTCEPNTCFSTIGEGYVQREVRTMIHFPFVTTKKMGVSKALMEMAHDNMMSANGLSRNVENTQPRREKRYYNLLNLFADRVRQNQISNPLYAAPLQLTVTQYCTQQRVMDRKTLRAMKALRETQSLLTDMKHPLISDASNPVDIVSDNAHAIRNMVDSVLGGSISVKQDPFHIMQQIVKKITASAHRNVIYKKLKAAMYAVTGELKNPKDMAANLRAIVSAMKPAMSLAAMQSGMAASRPI